MKYVGTYSDPKDIVTKDKLEAVASRVSTNEDNIVMAESDIEGLQTDVGTLKTNVGNVQTALVSKQDTVVGGASTITEDNLIASRALVSDSSGKVAVSDVTSTELSHLDGVTSNVQTQLNGKQPKITVNGIIQGDGAGNLSAAELNSSSVGLGNVDNVKQYSASNPPPYPVTSVNGQTGAITVHEVPAVTTSDNGKSAVVVNGAWAAVDKTPFYVNCTISGYGVYDEEVTHDKTLEEIVAAYQAGRLCYAAVKLSSWGDTANRFILPLVNINTSPDFDIGFAIFGFSSIDSADTPDIIDVRFIRIDYAIAEGIVTDRYLPENTQVLPEVSTSDNGKFLRVVNGAWAAVTISDANGGSF